MTTTVFPIDHFTKQIPIYPGEYLPGYISRLRYFASAIDPSWLMSFSGSTQLGKLHQLLPRVVSCFAYRASARHESGAILAQHSNARYWRGFAHEGAYRHHIDLIRTKPKSKRSLFIGEDLLQTFKPLSFCVACRDGDIGRYGVGVWHAEHQIPNMYKCSRHNIELSQFALPVGQSLLNYPIVNGDVLKVSQGAVITELHEWLNDVSFRFTASSTTENRRWIADLRADMTKALNGQEARGRVKVAKDVSKEWRGYVRDTLEALCTLRKDYFSVSQKKELSITQLLSPTNQRVHPLLFIVMLKFVEDHTGFSL